MLTYLQLLISHSFILLYQVDHQIVALNISKQLLQWIGMVVTFSSSSFSAILFKSTLNRALNSWLAITSRLLRSAAAKNNTHYKHIQKVERQDIMSNVRKVSFKKQREQLLPIPRTLKPWRHKHEVVAVEWPSQEWPCASLRWSHVIPFVLVQSNHQSDRQW